MSNIQSILAIGALFLLAMVSLSFNGALLQNNSVELENKVYLTAFSLADDMIEEIKEKGFDEATLEFPSVNPSTLTQPDLLGPESGETNPSQGYGPPYFDDIDDYNGFWRDANAPHAEDYHTTVKVYYVSEGDLEHISSVQTFYKRVDVTVSSPYLKNSVSLSFIFTHK